MSARCHVYVVASKPIGDDWPKGDCWACGLPLREHEKRVSNMAPPGTGYVIDEQLLGRAAERTQEPGA